MDLPIYFISDIHLMLNDSEDEQQRQRKLYRFMNYVRTTRGTLFFVGDLFDFYFEYPDMVPKAYFEFYNKAYQLKKAGVDLRFVVGNHDYWLMDFMKKKIMNVLVVILYMMVCLVHFAPKYVFGIMNMMRHEYE